MNVHRQALQVSAAISLLFTLLGITYAILTILPWEPTSGMYRLLYGIESKIVNLITQTVVLGTLIILTYVLRQKNVMYEPPEDAY
jgi:hypothetical protein